MMMMIVVVSLLFDAVVLDNAVPMRPIPTAIVHGLQKGARPCWFREWPMDAIAHEGGMIGSTMIIMMSRGNSTVALVQPRRATFGGDGP